MSFEQRCKDEGASYADVEKRAKEREANRPKAEAMLHRVLAPGPSYLISTIKLHIRVLIMPILQIRV